MTLLIVCLKLHHPYNKGSIAILASCPSFAYLIFGVGSDCLAIATTLVAANLVATALIAAAATTLVAALIIATA